MGRQVCQASGWSACDCEDTSAVGMPGPSGSGGSGGSGGMQDLPTSGGSRPAGNQRADILFDWARSDGPTGPCEAGVYSGTFGCEYLMDGQMPGMGILVEGPVNITLAEGSSAEILVIEDGTLDGAALLLVGFTAKIEGELTCGNDTLTAQVIDGVSTIGNMFEGDLSGTLERATQTLMGTWAFDVIGGGAMGTCAGTWTAVRQP